MAIDPHPALSESNLAVVGAGPVGLALALLAAEQLPRCRITLWDSRLAETDISGDPRTLALSLGSIHVLRRLQAWPGESAQPIDSVHVSQSSPTWGPLRQAEVVLTAASEKVEMLGAVISYGRLTAALQERWITVSRQQPQRLTTRFGRAVQHLRNIQGGVEVESESGEVAPFDLAVIAEGGVFAQQRSSTVETHLQTSAFEHDYQQTAWVGHLTLQAPHRGVAYESFSREGPVALLPLRDPSGRKVALVWCVQSKDDPLRDLNTAQRIHVLQTRIPAQAGAIESLSELKAFPLGFRVHPRLTDGRLVRIGNAAQTLHPVAGQGLNLGLRDAFALVTSLRQESPEEAARKLDIRRGPDRWSLLATTDFLARSFTWQLPGAATLRSMGLAALQGLPKAKSTLARHLMFGVR